jgi:hypothetical protein
VGWDGRQRRRLASATMAMLAGNPAHGSGRFDALFAEGQFALVSPVPEKEATVTAAFAGGALLLLLVSGALSLHRFGRPL